MIKNAIPSLSNTIIVTVAKIPDNINEINLEKLGNDIKCQAISYPLKRQRQFLMGRSLLAELLFNKYGVTTLPSIHYHGNKPIFSDSQYGYFNISHSHDYIAVALATTPIGLDIEKIVDCNHYSKIAKYCFSDKENQWLTLQPDSLSAFFQLWTQREAILKLNGKGVWQMKKMEIDREQSLIEATNFNQVHSITGYYEECVITLASHHVIPEPLLVNQSVLLTHLVYLNT